MTTSFYPDGVPPIMPDPDSPWGYLPSQPPAQFEGRQGPIGPDGKQGDVGPIGPAGKDGLIGRDGTDGRDGRDGRDGTNGQDGRGVSKSEIVDGNLVLTYTDGMVQNVGPVVGEGGGGSEGPPGPAGRGITGTSVNSNGHLIVTFTDGTLQDAGYVAGPPGSGGGGGGGAEPDVLTVGYTRLTANGTFDYVSNEQRTIKVTPGTISLVPLQNPIGGVFADGIWTAYPQFSGSALTFLDAFTINLAHAGTYEVAIALRAQCKLTDGGGYLDATYAVYPGVQLEDPAVSLTPAQYVLYLSATPQTTIRPETGNGIIDFERTMRFRTFAPNTKVRVFVDVFGPNGATKATLKNVTLPPGYPTNEAQVNLNSISVSLLTKSTQ